MKNSAANHVPVEIWIEVAITLRDTFPCSHGFSSSDGDPCLWNCDEQDTHSLIPLTQTSRFLYNSIQPILFEYVSLYIRPDYGATKMDSFSSTLIKKTDLQSAVRSLKLNGYRYSDGPPESFLQTLPLLVRLRSLSVESWKIDTAIIQLLQNSSPLRTLRLAYFKWGQEVPEDWPSYGQFGRKLESLCLDDIFHTDLRHVPNPSHLFVPTLTTLDVKSVFTFESMKTSPTFPFSSTLVSLHTYIEARHQDAFAEFVSQCPNIEHLTVIEDAMSHLDLGWASLPKLRSINAGSFLTMRLLQGRPIQSINVNPIPELFIRPLPSLEVLQLKSLNERDGGFQIVHGVLANCPGVLRLEIRCIGLRLKGTIVDRITTRLMSDIAALPRLQILCIRMNVVLASNPSPIKYPLSEKMLQERGIMVRTRRKHCPDLHDVWLHSEYAWIYKRADDAWVPKQRNMRP